MSLEQEFGYHRKLQELAELLNMVTTQDLQAGILTVTKSIDALQKAKQLMDKTSNLEAQEIILELRSQLVDTKSLLIDSKEEIISLKEENRQLKEQLENNQKLIFKDGVYYKDGDNVPFCPNCYEKSQKLIHLKTNNMPGFESFGKFDCPCCETFF